MPCVEVATLGGDYFRCTEAVLRHLRGLIDIKPGYMGGDRPNSTYKQICTGTTGHEVVQKTLTQTRLATWGILRYFSQHMIPSS